MIYALWVLSAFLFWAAILNKANENISFGFFALGAFVFIASAFVRP